MPFFKCALLEELGIIITFILIAITWIYIYIYIYIYICNKNAPAPWFAKIHMNHAKLLCEKIILTFTELPWNKSLNYLGTSNCFNN